MKIRFFTDPHIGLNRTSHTTPASRAKLKQALVDQVLALQDTDLRTVCLGDLFDTFDTDNQSLLNGIDIFKRNDLTLFGNHDLSNRVDQLSSIEVANRICNPGDIFLERDNGVTSPTANTMGSVKGKMWWVDHKLNQEIFEGALQDAYDRAGEGDILLLHCNYNSPFATQESTLNLSRDDAETLLEKFSYILMGHEHMPREDFDGRLILLGNTHPTGFSDISDKFAYDFEIEDGKVISIVKEQIWDENLGYLSLDWTDLSELTDVSPMVQFIEVKGTADQQHMPFIASQVAKLWTLSDNLLMVRNAVTSIAGVNEITINEATRCQSVPERISTELAGTKLEPLWSAYLGAI